MDWNELRITLKELEIRQVALAELLGVSPHTVKRWVHGQSPVPRYVALVLSLLAERKAADNRAEIAATVAPRLRQLLAEVETLNNAPWPDTIGSSYSGLKGGPYRR